ncbi:MAG: D-erythronate dehydrogenase [Granulosicoccus sp.]
MKILIIGAAGMVGSKLSRRLIEDQQLNGQALSTLTLVDLSVPVAPGYDGNTTTVKVNCLKADLTRQQAAARLLDDKPDVIYHLAAVVSGEAESDMRKGYSVNVDGMRLLLESIRDLHEADGYTPKLIFTSSIAVYGAPFPTPIPDEFHLTPLTSYGTQKAICELMLADYSRKEIIQGLGLRLPTICVRPGKPNKAASSFFSNIIREPINGQQAILPVEKDVQHWFASPRTAVDFLCHAASLDRTVVGTLCNMNLPGLCATVGEQIDALTRVVGTDAARLIISKPDTVIKAIVDTWPQSFDAKQAMQLGFKAEKTFDELVHVYLEDDYNKSTHGSRILD